MFGIAILLFGLVTSGTEVTASAPPLDGFCGYLATKACTRDLGLQWRPTPATKILEEEPVVSFQQIANAIDSLGGHVRETAILSSNQKSLEEIFQHFSNKTQGIARLASEDPDLQVGHFVVVTGLHPDGSIAAYDATTNERQRIRLEPGQVLPMLQVSTVKIPTSAWMGGLYLSSKSVLKSWVLAIALLSAAVYFAIKGRKSESTPSTSFSPTAPDFLQSSQQDDVPTNASIEISDKRLSSSRKIGGGLLFCLIAAVSLWAALWQWNGRSAQSLHFSQEEYQFGELAAMGTVMQSLSLVNPTDRPIEVEQVVGSCSCLELSPQKFTVGPGSSQVIDLKVLAVAPGDNWYVVEAEGAKCDIRFHGIQRSFIVPSSKLFGDLRGKADDMIVEHPIKIEDYTAAPRSPLVIRPLSENGKMVARISSDPVLKKDGVIDVEARLKEPTDHRGFLFEEFMLSLRDDPDAFSHKLTIVVRVIDDTPSDSNP